MKHLFFNIELRTILDFQIYIFLHLWLLFNNFFGFYVMVFNEIFYFFQMPLSSNFLFWRWEIWGFPNLQLELGMVYSLIYPLNLKSNDINDLFFRGICRTTSKSVNCLGIYAPREMVKGSCRFTISCLTCSIWLKFGFH